MKITLIGSTPSKKNSRINTRSGRSFPSSKYTAWHKDAMKQVAEQSIPKSGKIDLMKITFHAGDLRKFDLTNKAESIMDLLVDCGILEDDNYSIVPNLLLSFGGLSRDNPYCEIEY